MIDKKIKQGFILEDHLPTLQWLQSALRSGFPEIQLHHASSVIQAKEILRHIMVDIALIDLGLPDGTGLTIIKQLHTTQPDCQKIVTTTFSDDEHIFSALQSGAQGYIVKEQQPEKIVKLLQASVAGEPALSPQIARRIINYFQPQTSVADLTPRQIDVLQLISRGYKNKEVAEFLKISAHTVHGYIKEIYAILGINSRSEATLEASKRGLIGSHCE